MTNLRPIVKGNLVSEADALADLEKLADVVTPRERNPQPAPSPTPAVFNLQNGLYLIDKPRILAATTPAYRKFLKDSGYGDLNACSAIGFAKGVLRIDLAVRNAAAGVNLNLQGNDGDYVVNINHPNARKLVEALGYKVPTVGLMYHLFIPYIKNLADQGNAEAQATLDEMTNASTGKAEWLEDLILDKTRLKIGTKERRLSLPDKDGRFDRADISEWGYPVAVKDSGEFYYWHPRGNEVAAFRDWDSGLVLLLSGEPSIEFGVLAVRPQKFFP